MGAHARATDKRLRRAARQASGVATSSRWGARAVPGTWGEPAPMPDVLAQLALHGRSGHDNAQLVSFTGLTRSTKSSTRRGTERHLASRASLSGNLLALRGAFCPIGLRRWQSRRARKAG